MNALRLIVFAAAVAAASSRAASAPPNPRLARQLPPAARAAAEARAGRLKALRGGLLVCGDSHAACRLPHSDRDAWIVANLLGVPETNRLAVSGSTAAQWAADANGWLTAATNNRAPVVWVSLGGNDAMAALGDGQVTPDEIGDAAAAYLRALRALAAGRRLVIATAYANPFQGARADAAAGAVALNAGVRSLAARACREAGTPLAILDEPLVLGPANFDGSGDLHPDAAGYTNMAHAIRAAIMKGNGK